MSDIIHIPPFATPAKPTFGSPCNGCGLCCHREVCGIGQIAFSTDQAPCPGIVYKEGRTWCLVILAEKMTQKDTLLADALGIGTSCDAIIKEEQIDEEFNQNT